jgi:hypothetical protein
MTPLPRPSVSPLPSFCSTVPREGRTPTLAEGLQAIWHWARPRVPGMAEQYLERRVIERILYEQDELTSSKGDGR